MTMDDKIVLKGPQLPQATHQVGSDNLTPIVEIFLFIVGLNTAGSGVEVGFKLTLMNGNPRRVAALSYTALEAGRCLFIQQLRRSFEALDSRHWLCSIAISATNFKGRH